MKLKVLMVSYSMSSFVNDIAKYVHDASMYLNPKVGFHIPTHFYAHPLLRITFTLADRLIAISKDAANHLKARGAPTNKIILVYNGTDSIKFNPKIDGQNTRKKWD